VESSAKIQRERGLSGVIAALAIAAVASCGPTRLSPIFALDASIRLGDAPVNNDVPPPDAPVGVDAPDGWSGELPASFVCPDVMVGYATLGAGTTGGGAVPPVPATTLAELMLYASQNDDPMVIEISNVISLSDQVRVKSNKTIRGTVPGAGLVGGGLNLTDSHNVIIQRLTISQAVKTDAVSVTRATNIWIDHCDFASDMSRPKDTFDGLVDITHASDWVTVSWTKFHNHWNVGLIGHDELNGAEDLNHLTVTYHHNWFFIVNSNTPRSRFGSVHVFNNLFQDITGTAIVSVMGAQTLIEGNVFQNVKYPIATTYELDPQPGTVNERDNIFENSVKNPSLALTTWTPTAYSVFPDPTYQVSAIVQTCAGANF
jgi:pectate lyase